MSFLACTNADAVGDDLSIKGRTILHNREPKTVEGAKTALITGILNRKVWHIDKLQNAGILRTSTLLDVHNDYDDAVRAILRGEKRLMF